MEPILKNCDNCGKEFEVVHKERIQNRTHLFCCKKCEGEFKRKNNPNWVRCVICGKEIYRKPKEIKQNKYGICCSKACAAILKETIYKGNNNPNYGNKGQKNPIWKSDTKINPYGYILIRDETHPFKNCDGFVFEHRIIAEQYLLTDKNSIEINGKKYLSPDYIVHHKDGNRQNNNIENLEIMTRAEHTHYHAEKRKQLAS